MRGGRRGSAFITVLAVLALLAILMEIALQLLVAHVNESRRHADAAYAGELARSGLDWARACVASGAPGCDRTLELRGGTITITSERDGEMVELTARATIARGLAEGPSREARTRVRAPDPGAAPSAAPTEPAPGPEPTVPPEPAPTPDPGSLEHRDGAAPSDAPEPPPADPSTELTEVPHP